MTKWNKEFITLRSSSEPPSMQSDMDRYVKLLATITKYYQDGNVTDIEIRIETRKKD